MKITGLNLDIIWKNKTENFQQIEKELQNQEADLFLLPEMFSTGFVWMHPKFQTGIRNLWSF
jgi:predicted amidohydrolase